MSSLVSSLGYNFSGQLVARIISFGINMYLLRVIDNDVLGLVNVRLTLLYNTILFLTREPMRKAHIFRESLPQFMNLVWLSPLISLFLSVLLVLFWQTFSTSGTEVSAFVLWASPVSAIIEAFAEPFAVVSLRFSLGRHFAIGQSLLIFLQRFFSFFSCLFLVPFCVPFGSFRVCSDLRFLYISAKKPAELSQFAHFSSLLPQKSAGIDRESLKALFTMFSHSILKQLLTDGSAYVMTFTELLTLKNQAVYDAVERVGSLAARIILAPMEENCYAYFANNIRKQSTVFKKNSDSYDALVQTLSTILHVVGVVGCVVCVFGIPYSANVVYIYGGNLLYENQGALLLSLYSVYVWVMAINGITECFAMASMDNVEVVSHGSFLLASAIGHLVLNVSLCFYFNSAGFIIANIVNMLVRIVYSWRHIRRFLGERTPPLTTLFPTLTVLGSLVFCFFATSFSYLLFGSTPGFSHAAVHIAIGGVLFGLLSLNIAQHDPVFSTLVNSALKPHYN
ncbi:unnamed protein product [Caenorhabditis auriculariae]|uniref:Protein RFT1 homolog n=1 Tax=Caenorhabditis auriculariae TaxID=2777116 RepID=A0A8S1H5V4_9PELO|nr:unnamed protein product [Caenorhabditis auriculariae]